MASAEPPAPQLRDLPPREQWPSVNAHCPVVGALDVVSTRSAFLVLREAFYGTTRFDQFAERAEISEPVAAARLRELTDAGLLEKRPYREPGRRTRSEYRLTEQGAELFPVLLALYRWGERWLPDRGRRLDFTHADCGSPVHAVLACEAGHPVAVEQIEVRARRRPARDRQAGQADPDPTAAAAISTREVEPPAR